MLVLFREQHIEVFRGDKAFLKNTTLRVEIFSKTYRLWPCLTVKNTEIALLLNKTVHRLYN